MAAIIYLLLIAAIIYRGSCNNIIHATNETSRMIVTPSMKNGIATNETSRMIATPSMKNGIATNLPPIIHQHHRNNISLLQLHIINSMIQ